MTPLGPSQIFISYRRDDAAGDAGRLADHLHSRFGTARVFLDIDTIQPGADFMQVLHEALLRTAAMLVVIGPRWTTVRAADGTRRLDSPDDVVRLEVEGALGRGIPVVPVLVEGASLPRADELPPSLRPLVGRQATTIDHAEFHADADRLCKFLATLVPRPRPSIPALLRSWRAAAALLAVIALGVAGYWLSKPTNRQSAVLETRSDDARSPVNDDTSAKASPADAASGSAARAITDAPAARDARAGSGEQGDRRRRAEALVTEASMQQRRNQYVDALATLARARELAPDSDAVQRAQADAAMNWIRHAHVEPGKSTFGDAIKPALSVVDAALPSATGQRRADLLAHSGWATFLLWRDGDRQLDPTDWYQQALAIDPTNPYANAMLAHWILFRGDDVARAAALFATALRSGRAVEDVRTLQWAAYGNSSTPAAGVERVRLADAMRRAGEKLDERQASSLRATYYFAMPNSHQKERQALLEAVAPDDQIATLKWAFGDDTDPSRQLMIRYYAAQLDAAAGRVDKAVADLRALQRDIGDNPGSLLTAVQQALERLAPGATRKR